jgi:hypothetical protein
MTFGSGTASAADPHSRVGVWRWPRWSRRWRRARAFFRLRRLQARRRRRPYQRDHARAQTNALLGGPENLWLVRRGFSMTARSPGPIASTDRGDSSGIRWCGWAGDCRSQLGYAHVPSRDGRSSIFTPARSCAARSSRAAAMFFSDVRRDGDQCVRRHGPDRGNLDHGPRPGVAGAVRLVQAVG